MTFFKDPNTRSKAFPIILVGLVLLVLLISGLGKLYGSSGDSQELTRYSAIGTNSSPRTLTTAYGGASSTALLAKGLPNISIAGSYTPKSHGSILYLLVERSLDNGSTFKPYSILQAETTGVQVYTSGTSTSAGTPFVIGGAGATASGTAIGFSFDLTMAADYIRVQAKESTTSTAGTLHAQTLLSN